MALAPSHAHIAFRDSAEKLTADKDALFREVLTRGSIFVELYAPEGVDRQKPHERDELYVVVQGSGEFCVEEDGGDKIIPFEAGDVLFVEAGRAHRFVNFRDLKVWVLFYGAKGGEQ